MVIVAYGSGLLSSATPQCYLLLQVLAYSLFYGVQVCNGAGVLWVWLSCYTGSKTVGSYHGGYVVLLV